MEKSSINLEFMGKVIYDWDFKRKKTSTKRYAAIIEL